MRHRVVKRDRDDDSDSDGEWAAPGGARGRQRARGPTPDAGVARAAGAAACGAVGAPSPGGGPSDAAVPGAGAARVDKNSAHFCAQCCVAVERKRWYLAKRNPLDLCHEHACAGGFGGKSAAGRNGKAPCSTCKLNRAWLVAASELEFEAYLDWLPTLRRVWDALSEQEGPLPPALAAEVRADLRGKGTSLEQAVAILRERMQSLSERKGAFPRHNPNSGGAASDASDVDSVLDGVVDAPAAQPPPLPQPGPPLADVATPAPGGAAFATRAPGRCSNVSPHVVVELAGRFGDMGALENALQGTSVVLLLGAAGVGKTALGERLAQRRARAEHNWRLHDYADWAGGSDARPPPDAVGPFCLSLRGAATPAAASLLLLRTLQLWGAAPAAYGEPPEAEAPEALHAALAAALPDRGDGGPASVSSCLFVLDDCDALLTSAGAHAAWAWALRLAGVAQGARVVMMARSGAPPPAGADERAAAVITLPPLPPSVVRDWIAIEAKAAAQASPAAAASGLVRPLSASDAAALSDACGGLPGVIAPLVCRLHAGLLGSPRGLLEALGGDAPGRAAKALEAQGVPPALLRLPDEAAHLAAEIDALAALAGRGAVHGAFSRADARLALGYATRDRADEVVAQLRFHRIVLDLGHEELQELMPPRAEDGAEDDVEEDEAAAETRRVFRMCGLRATLARGSAAWAEARARLDVAAEAAAMAACAAAAEQAAALPPLPPCAPVPMEAMPAPEHGCLSPGGGGASPLGPSLLDMVHMEQLDGELNFDEVLAAAEGASAGALLGDEAPALSPQFEPKPLSAVGEDSSPSRTAHAAQLVCSAGLDALVGQHAAPAPGGPATRAARRGLPSPPSLPSLNRFSDAPAFSAGRGEDSCGRSLRSRSRRGAAAR